MSMRERPILFSAESICAILRDAKTQTRRVIKFPRRVLPAEIAASTVAYPDGGGNWVFWGGPDFPGLADFTRNSCPFGDGIPCPYGKPGDRLWVRETYGYEVGRATTVYRADVDAGLFAWKSPIFWYNFPVSYRFLPSLPRISRIFALTSSRYSVLG